MYWSKGTTGYLVEYDIIVSFGSFQLQVKGFCIGLFTSCHAKKNSKLQEDYPNCCFYLLS